MAEASARVRLIGARRSSAMSTGLRVTRGVMGFGTALRGQPLDCERSSRTVGPTRVRIMGPGSVIRTGVEHRGEKLFSQSHDVRSGAPMLFGTAPGDQHAHHPQGIEESSERRRTEGGSAPHPALSPLVGEQWTKVCPARGTTLPEVSCACASW